MNNVKISQYGYLRSVRHQAKKTNDLINKIAANFGKRIEHGRLFHYIDRDGYVIWFRRRGNKYADWLELLSYDVDVLRRIKQVFMKDFKADLEIKEGEL
jgi:hypothetical protein